MTRWVTRIGIGLAVLIGLTALTYLFVIGASRSETVRHQVETRLASATRSEVHLGALHLGYDLAFHAGQFSAAVAGQAPYIEADGAVVRVSPFGWSFDLTLVAPRVRLRHIPDLPRDQGGGGNALALRSLQVADAMIEVPFGKGDVPVGPWKATVEMDGEGGTVEANLAEMSAKLEDISIKVGAAQARARWDSGAEGRQLSGSFEVGPLSANDRDRNRAIERLSLSAKFTTKADVDEPISVTADISQGELLWYRFYADLAALAPDLSAAVQRDKQGFAAKAIKLTLRHLGSFEGEAHAQSKGTVDTIRGSIAIPDADKLFALVVREPFQESYPSLAQARVDGQLHIKGEYRAQKSTTIDGHARLTHGRVAAATSVVEGLDLDLPLAIGSRSRGGGTGELSFEHLQTGVLEFGPTRLPLIAGPDQVGLSRSVTLPTFGGEISIDELVATELSSPSRHLRLGLSLQRMDLAQLSRALGWPEFDGTLSGELPRMKIATDEVRSEGEMRAQVFNGEVKIRNLHFERLLSPLASFGTDLSFDDISLRRLTKTLKVGRVSGVARGGVDNLTVAAGEPTSFDAWFETVDDRGEKQTISVRAIRQISILGGSGGDPLSSRVMSLFDEYRYSQMGFRCRLENDRFLLRGVREIGDKQYLVVGSLLPPRVDVISHTEVIAFSDMVERLRRVSAERAESEEADEGEQ